MRRLTMFVVTSACLILATTEAFGESNKKEDAYKWQVGIDCKDPANSKKLQCKKFKGYGMLSPVFVFPVFGKVTSPFKNSGNEPEQEAEFSATVLAGANFAAFFVPIDRFHIGIYLQLARGRGSLEPDLPEDETWIRREDQGMLNAIGFGVAAKFTGFRLNKRLLLGVELDFGGHFFKFDSWADQYTRSINSILGIELSPAMVLDVLVFENESKKITMPVRLGVETVPFAQGYNCKFTQISIFASVGLTFGKSRSGRGLP